MARCLVNTMVCLIPFPAVIVIELPTRNLSLRGLGTLVMAALLISVLIVCLGAAIMFVVRCRESLAMESGLAPRHVLAPLFVAIVHFVCIIWFLASPFPVAISGM